MKAPFFRFPPMSSRSDRPSPSAGHGLARDRFRVNTPQDKALLGMDPGPPNAMEGQRREMTKHRGGFWEFFSSVRLAIGLLAAIALWALIGTVIPQQDEAALSGRLHPGLLALFRALQLFDVYHSAWFILMLFLLAINLTACSLKRFPSTWRLIRGQDVPDVKDDLESLPPERIVMTDRTAAAEASRLESLLRSHVGRVREAQTDRGFVLAGSKGAFSRLGVFVVHLGVLLLIAGGLAGAVFGVQGHVEIAEGDAANTVNFRNGKAPMTLPFSIRCDRFTVEHYDNGVPKVFRSDLSFIQDGKAVRQGALLVNHPIAFGGFRFYQSSYGPLPVDRASLSYVRGNGRTVERQTATGERFALPGNDGEVEVLRIESDLMRMGPAVKLSVASPRGKVQFWVFQNIDRILQANPGLLEQIPQMNPALFAPYRFDVRIAGERFFTVLQASRDPGVPIVVSGAVLLAAGLMMIFFFSHRRYRIVLRQEEGRCRIGLAGSSNRDPVGLEKEMNRLLAEIGKTEGSR